MLLVLLAVAVPGTAAGQEAGVPADERYAFLEAYLSHLRGRGDVGPDAVSFLREGPDLRLRGGWTIPFAKLPGLVDLLLDRSSVAAIAPDRDSARTETLRLLILARLAEECGLELAGAPATSGAWATLGPRSAAALVAALTTADDPLRRAIERALPLIGDDSTASVLIDAGSEVPSRHRLSHVRLVCSIPGPASAAYLRDILTGEYSPELVTAAIEGVSHAEDGAAVDRIAKFLRPASRAPADLRAAAAGALARIGNDRAREALATAFGEAQAGAGKESLAVHLASVGGAAGIAHLEARLASLEKAGGDPGASDRIRRLLEEKRLLPVLGPVRRKHDLPALGAAVVTSEGLLAVGATGFRRKGAKVPVTADDIWHIGSCTKAMTATLVGRLVEKGQLRWDSRLADSFPDLAERIAKGYRPVTLAMLLAHVGGAPADLTPDGLWGRLWKHPGPPTAARRVLTEGVLTRPPVSVPGSKYLYSNAGYAIVGHAAERAARASYEDLMWKEVFTPLGMRGTGFGAPGSPGLIDQPHGHRPGRSGATPVDPGPGADNPAAIAPAGTVHAPLADWARFVRLHLRGARPGKEPLLLTRETLARIRTPEAGRSYAFGWGIAERDWGGGRVLTHSGSNTMWFAVAWLAPERDFAVLVVTNQGGGRAARACDEAAGALIGWFLGRKDR